MSTKRKKMSSIGEEIIDPPSEKDEDDITISNNNNNKVLILDIIPKCNRKNNTLIQHLQIISLLLHPFQEEFLVSLIPNHIMKSFSSLLYIKEDVLLLYTHIKNNPHPILKTIPHLYSVIKGIGIRGHVHLFASIKMGKMDLFMEINDDLYGFSNSGDEYYMLDCHRGIHDVSVRFLKASKYYEKKKIPFLLTTTTTTTVNDCWTHKEPLEIPIPLSISSFKKHNIYSLDSLLTRTQQLKPSSKIVGKFASHNIILREDISCLRSEKGWWINYGRVVMSKEKKDYYAEWETIPYCPPSLGPYNAIPINQFGNVDLFRGDPSFIPINTCFIDDRLAARVCKMLKVGNTTNSNTTSDPFNWAPACVGFKFGGRQPRPILRGAIIPKSYSIKINDLIIRMRIKNTLISAPLNNENMKNKKRCKQYKLIIKDDDDDSTFDDFFPSSN